MIFRLLFCFLLFSFLFVKPFASDAKNAVTNYDSTHVKVRAFDQAALDKYAADRDFNYDRVSLSVSPSLWEQFWNWFWSLFPDVISNAKKGGNAKYIFIVLGCAAIVFAVVKFFGMDIRMIFTGKAKQIEVPYEESIENIHEISFNDEIQKAINNNDFRLAVRLLYLKSLKELNDAGRIKWEIDKTNSQYINELRHPDQKHQFRDLTRQFEYVWYGNFNIDKGSFLKISDSFKNFKSVLR